jgi:hypothetical protein
LDLIEEIKEVVEYVQPERPPPVKHNGYYDARFCNLFLEELETRNFPLYPEGPWFGALRTADYKFKDLPSESVIAPVNGSGYVRETTTGVPERHLYANLHGDHSEGALRQVGAACVKWLSSR